MKGKRKLTICALTAFIMVFTAIPAAAFGAVGDETVVPRKYGRPSTQNAIAQACFKETADGKFQVFVNVDTDVYSIYTAPSFFNVYNKREVLVGYSAAQVQSWGYWLPVSPRLVADPGETVYLSAAGKASDNVTFIPSSVREQDVKNNATSFTAPTISGPDEPDPEDLVNRVYSIDPAKISRTDGNVYVGVNWPTYAQAGKKFYVYDGTTGNLLRTTTSAYDNQFAVEPSKTYKFVVIIASAPVTDPETIKGLCNAVGTYTVPSLDTLKKDMMYDVARFTAASPRYDQIALSFGYDYQHASAHKLPSGYYLYRNGSLIKNLAKDGTYTDAGLRVDTAYTYTIVPYQKLGTKIYTGNAVTRTFRTASFKAASLSVTRISGNRARVTVKVPDAQRFSNASTFYVYNGKKKIKTIKNTGSASYAFTYNKKKAGSAKYKVIAQCTQNKAKKTSKYYKPASNVKTWKYSTAPAAYPSYSHFWRPSKFYYSGGKLKVKGSFINTHIYNMSHFKIKLTIKCQGKKIATQTFNSKQIKAMSKKNMTFTFKKGKKNYDLRNGSTSWSYQIVSWN